MGKKTNKKGPNKKVIEGKKTEESKTIDNLEKYNYLNSFKGLIYKTEPNSFTSSEQLENELKNDPLFQSELEKHLENLKDNLLIKLYNIDEFLSLYQNNIELANQDIVNFAKQKGLNNFQTLLIKLGTPEPLILSITNEGFTKFATEIEKIENLKIPRIFKYYIISRILNNFIQFNIENKIIYIINVYHTNIVFSPSTLNALILSLSNEAINELKIFITNLKYINENAYNIYSAILGFITGEDLIFNIAKEEPLVAALLACSYGAEYDFDKIFKDIDFSSLSEASRTGVIQIFNSSIMNGNLNILKILLKKNILSLFTEIEIAEYLHLILTRGNAEYLIEFFNYLAINNDKLNLNYIAILNSLELDEITTGRLDNILLSIIENFRNGILSNVALQDFIYEEQYMAEATLFLRSFVTLIIVSNQEVINKGIKGLKNILNTEVIDKMLIVSGNKKEILINAISPYIEKIIFKAMQSSSNKLIHVLNIINNLIHYNKKDLAQDIVRKLFKDSLINLDFLIFINGAKFKEVLLEQTNLIDIIEQSDPVSINEKESVSNLLHTLVEENFIEITSENLLKIEQTLKKNEIDLTHNLLLSIFNNALNAKTKLEELHLKEKEIEEKEKTLENKLRDIDKKEKEFEERASFLKEQEARIHKLFIERSAALKQNEANYKQTHQNEERRLFFLFQQLQQEAIKLKKSKQEIEKGFSYLGKKEEELNTKAQEIANSKPQTFEIKTTEIIEATKIFYQTNFIDPFGQLLYTHCEEGETIYSPPTTTTTTQTIYASQNEPKKDNNNKQPKNNKLSESDLVSKIDQNKFKEVKIKQKALSLKKLNIDAVIVNEEKEDYNFAIESIDNAANLKPLERLNATANAEQSNKIGFDNHSSFVPILTMGGEGSNFINFDQDPLQQVNIAY